MLAQAVPRSPAVKTNSAIAMKATPTAHVAFNDAVSGDREQMLETRKLQRDVRDEKKNCSTPDGHAQRAALEAVDEEVGAGQQPAFGRDLPDRRQQKVRR